MSSISTIKDIRKEWSIPKNGEFRFEVDEKEMVSIKLLSGTAEVFGQELSINKEYEIRGSSKLAIFSYDGARAMVRGNCIVEYLSEETMMHAYLNTHLAIERMRKDASDKGEEAPRVIVVGQSRTTVARILVNYAVRAGKIPMYVDLDVSNGTSVMAGVISAQVMDKLIDIEDGFGEGQQSCMYFYGGTNPSENPKLFKRLLSRLAFSSNGRLTNMNDPKKSGAIICAPSDCEDLISDIQELFKANLILVVGNERLHATISKALQNKPTCTVLKLPKSGGVVNKDNSFRRRQTQTQFQRYFYGQKHEYSPFSIVLSFDDIQLRRLGEDTLAPKSALPLGANRKVDETKALKVEPTNVNLLYSIAAVSWASTEEQLIDSNIAGFIYITDIDENKKQITALSMCPGKLPSQFLLLGNLKWIEK